MLLTKTLLGCSGGALYPETYVAGVECPADLIEAAIETGALEFPADVPPDTESKAQAGAPENKADSAK
jgi:hypothetical protein